MATLQEISAKADELQATVDAEQQQIRDLLDQNTATITGLNETIAQLQADGGNAEARQAVLDKLNTMKTDIEETVAGITPPPPPVGEGANG